MRCSRVEKLLPLYVENDLATRSARVVAAHLRGCDNCEQLASEYRASQARLRLYAPTELDEDSFAELRRNVLSQIARGDETRALAPFPLSKVFEFVTPRAVFALALTLVFLVFSALAFRLSLRRAPVADPASSSPPASAATAAQTQLTSRSNENLLARDSHDTRVWSLRPHITRRRAAVVAAALRPAREIISVRRTEATTAIPNSSQAFIGSPETVRYAGTELTRIEIQTSDPTIRIIWLAPRAER